MFCVVTVMTAQVTTVDKRVTDENVTTEKSAVDLQKPVEQLLKTMDATPVPKGMSLKLVSVIPIDYSKVDIPRDAVMVTLEAHNVWGDGSGYQLLLDADANEYGNTIPTTGALYTSCSAPSTLYDVFEYKIPENADPVCTTANAVIDGMVTITIPNGTYDYCITNPTPGDRIWIASDNCDPGRADDFVFNAGFAYHFSINMDGAGQNDCTTITESISNMELPAAPTNFVMTPDPDQGLSATLSWTNPTTTLGGTPLANLSSVVLLRNGVIIQEFNNPTVGENMTYEDTSVPSAGTYVYTVYAVNSEGNGGSATVSGIIGGIFFMPTTGTQTITACSGVIYDSGGPTGTYSANENGILIIQPNDPELGTQVSGSFAGIETNYDKLYIYDGAGIEGELLGTYSNSSGGDIPLTSSTLGPLTLHFTSDGSVHKDGFELTISCQPINAGCLPPASLSYSNVSDASVVLAWFVYGEQNLWNIEYGPMGFTQGTGTTVSASTNPYTLTGLEAATAYDWYIQADCGEAGQSAWAGPSSFITAVSCPEGSTSVSPIIGNGTDETYYIPVNTFYKYSYVQQLITADELMAQGAFFGNVYSLSFQYFYGTPQTKDPVQVYVGNTDKETFSSTTDWVPVSEMTLVYEGPVDFDNTGAGFWKKIQFQNPFVYDGASNIVITVLNNNGAYTTSSNKTFYTHAENSTAKTLYYRVDGSAPIDPNNPPTASGILDYRNNMSVEMCVTAPEMTTVSGVVSSSLTGGSIAGASVKYQGALGNTIITDASGTYTIDLVQDFSYNITVTADGYCSYQETDFVAPAGSATKNFSLDRPQIAVDPTNVNVVTNYGIDGHATVTISNTGTGNLNYNLATAYRSDSNKGPWDLAATFNATAGGMQGVATDGNNIYLVSWQATPSAGWTFEKYDMDLNFVEGFNISGVSAIRDLSYDGTYFYGGAGSSVLYCLDLANKTLISTISTGVSIIRHCSYDPVNDGFWIGNWTDLFLVNRNGTTVTTGPTLESAYGSGYDNVTEGGPYLLLFCQPNSDAKVYRYNIATNTLESTPVFDFANCPGFVSGSISGGAFVGPYDGKICFYGNVQQTPNLIGIYELGLAGWLTCEPTAGSIPAGSTATINMTMNGSWAEEGTFYATVTTATSNPSVGSVPINVTFTIIPLYCPKVTNIFAFANGFESVDIQWITPGGKAHDGIIPNYKEVDASVPKEEIAEPANGTNIVPAVPVVRTQTRDELFSNAVFITHVGAGFGGGDVSSLWGSESTYGPNANNASGYMLADDIVLNEESTIEEIEFYAYQTGSGPVSTITGVFVCIYDANPIDGGEVIWGDQTTNLMTSTDFSGVYRTMSSELTSSTRPIMNVIAGINTTLPAGTYWVAVSFTGSASSGPWGCRTEIIDVIDSGNGIQYGTSGWTVLTDSGSSGSYGVPMIVRGTSGNLPPTPNGLLGYNVYRDGNKINTDLVTITMYNDDNVNPSTEYCYNIEAVYEICVKMSEAQGCVTTADACLPPASITLTQLDGEDDVRISWTEPTAGTPSGYNIYRDDVKIAHIITETFLDDLNAPAGTYAYGVSAVYPHCESTTVESEITVIGLSAFENMMIYPNPTNGKINISGVSVANVKVYNNIGQLIESLDNTNAFSVADYGTGVFYLKVTTETGNTNITKIVVVQ